MHIEQFIHRLSGVRSTGKGRYIAHCTAHNDKSPSLAISEGDDGRILIHCFAGCSAHDVMASIGLSLSELYAERINHRMTPMARRMSYQEAWMICQRAFYVLMVASEDFQAGIQLSSDDKLSVDEAINEIGQTIRVMNCV